MKVKICHFRFSQWEEIKEEEVKVLYKCHHVKDDKLYDSINDIKFDDSSEYLLIENKESPYGYSVLWLIDKENKVYEYEGFGHSGACSVICSLLKDKLNGK